MASVPIKAKLSISLKHKPIATSNVVVLPPEVEYKVAPRREVGFGLGAGSRSGAASLGLAFRLFRLEG
tara:strand:+ start:55 stop:258 length:204 start_codon:yes stop_codon:yes gene_type:complete